MLLPPHVPQPIDSENGSALSKLPPVAKQCTWLTITRQTGSVRPSCDRALRRRACASPTECPRPGSASSRSASAAAAAKSATR